MTLTAGQQQQARSRAVQAARLAYQNRAAVHYTQGPQRWQGIAQQLKASAGRYPNYADCSSFATWCLWCALHPLGAPDVVNGQNWQAGYTGTMLAHGQVVTPSAALPGDCVLYGTPGSTGAHTAIVVQSGNVPTVVSHGSEAGPYLLAYNYRPDIMNIRRYITGTAADSSSTPAKPPPSTVPAVKTPPPLHVDYFDRRHNPKCADVRVWQQRMKARGWRLAVDGVYGPESERICRQFQREKRLAVDGQVGPQTWRAAWTAPVT